MTRTLLPPHSQSKSLTIGLEVPRDSEKDDILPERRFPIGLNRDPKSDYGRTVFRHVVSHLMVPKIPSDE